MTVIAYRNGLLASDSLVGDHDGNKYGACSKVKKVKGWLLGAAGDFDATEAFMQKFDPENIKRKLFTAFYTGGLHVEEFEAIAVSPSGKIYEVSAIGVFGQIKAEYYAIGCGALIAFGAMAHGAGARGAVKAAIKHSVGCGGRIQYVISDDAA